ncbi:MAG: zinc-binding dehydrogenase [Pseudomonadota bacterium]
MKAAISHGVGEPLKMADLSFGDGGPKGVKVKLAAVAICHSDIAFLDGEWPTPWPAVFGHEAAGIVEAVGDAVSRVQVGDRVCVTLARACHNCGDCADGRPIDCTSSTELDHRPILFDESGTPVLQGIRTGAFAEYALVDESQVVSIPKTVPWSSAAVISCAVLTGYGAVARTAPVKARQSVAIIGAGGVGMNCIQAAKIAGASEIMAIDMSDDRLRLATEFGATSHVNPKAGGLEDHVANTTHGRGLDHVFVCVGSSKAIESAVDLLAPGGAVTLVGMPEVGASITIDPLTLASANKSLIGSKFGGAVVSEDIPRLTELYLDKSLKLDELVTREFTFEAINDALNATRRGEGLRNVVRFDWSAEAPL